MAAPLAVPQAAWTVGLMANDWGGCWVATLDNVTAGAWGAKMAVVTVVSREQRWAVGSVHLMADDLVDSTGHFSAVWMAVLLDISRVSLWVALTAVLMAELWANWLVAKEALLSVDLMVRSSVAGSVAMTAETKGFLWGEWGAGVLADNSVGKMERL